MGNEQQSLEQKSKRKPVASKQKTDHVERKFNQVRDLLLLEFSLDGIETLNVYDATPEQMQTLATTYSTVSEVNIEVWPVGERLDFVNGLWDFCQSKNFTFPLYVKEIEPHQERGEEYSALNLASNFSQENEEREA